MSNGTATSSDFTFQDPQSGKLIFKPGEITKNLSVNIINNTKPEMNESFTLQLDSDDGVTNVPGAVQIFILDDGAYFFQLIFMNSLDHVKMKYSTCPKHGTQKNNKIILNRH